MQNTTTISSPRYIMDRDEHRAIVKVERDCHDLVSISLSSLLILLMGLALDVSLNHTISFTKLSVLTYIEAISLVIFGASIAGYYFLKKRLKEMVDNRKAKEQSEKA